MRKTIFVFATTVLALWWVFEPIVASARYSKSNEAKLDAAAYMVQLALGEITEEQYHQNLNAVAGITKKEA